MKEQAEEQGVDVEKKVIGAVAEILEVSVDFVHPLKSFKYDLKADSLAVIEIVLLVEEAFKIEIGDDELNGAADATVGDLVACVKKKLDAK